jgi:hypothetical protein
MKKTVYQLEFPYWDKVKKRSSIIKQLNKKDYGKRGSNFGNYDYSRSLRGISEKHSKTR